MAYLYVLFEHQASTTHYGVSAAAAGLGFPIGPRAAITGLELPLPSLRRRSGLDRVLGITSGHDADRAVVVARSERHGDAVPQDVLEEEKDGKLGLAADILAARFLKLEPNYALQPRR